MLPNKEEQCNKILELLNKHKLYDNVTHYGDDVVINKLSYTAILLTIGLELNKWYAEQLLKHCAEVAKMTGIAYGNDKCISDYEVDKQSILNIINEVNETL